MKRRRIKRHQNPKAKGSEYERSVCKRLSLWVTSLTRSDVFWRSASSGGQFTQQRKKSDKTVSGRRRETLRGLNDDAQAGDICLTHESGADFIRLFVVECKHRRGMGLELMVYGRKGCVEEFWSKVRGEGQACNPPRIPLIVMRENSQPELLLTNNEGYRLLRFGGVLPLQATFPKYDLHVLLFRDVLMLNWKQVAAMGKLKVTPG